MANAKRVTTTQVVKKKQKAEKIVMITAYDYPTACLVDEAGVDVVLVGDSLGMVILGYETTLPVTLDEMVHHTKAVARGVKRALVAADLPFLSYQTGPAEALRSAGRLLQEAAAAAVKLEGGANVCPQIQALVGAGIPVIGHLGLTPQSIHVFGGYKLQGRGEEAAQKMLADARGDRTGRGLLFGAGMHSRRAGCPHHRQHLNPDHRNRSGGAMRRASAGSA